MITPVSLIHLKMPETTKSLLSQNTPCFVCTILSCLKQQNAHVVDNRFAASESANSRHNLLPYVQFVILSSGSKSNKKHPYDKLEVSAYHLLLNNTE